MCQFRPLATVSIEDVRAVYVTEPAGMECQFPRPPIRMLVFNIHGELKMRLSGFIYFYPDIRLLSWSFPVFISQMKLIWPSLAGQQIKMEILHFDEFNSIAGYKVLMMMALTMFDLVMSPNFDIFAYSFISTLSGTLCNLGTSLSPRCR